MTESGEGPTARVIPWRTRGTSPADAIDILAERGREAAVITLPADHRPPGPASSPPPDRQRRLSDAVAFGRRRITGQYGVDEFGFDADLTEHVLIPALRPLYDRWFRVEVNGTENIPVTGGALLVANHGGGLWPLDAVMTAVAVHEHSTEGRYLRTLAADLLLRTPGFGALARKGGATFAGEADAERLLRRGELVGAWPEGSAGMGKRFRDRYVVQQFHRDGFVAAALRAGVPIVPVSIVGAEEIHPVLGHARLLARVFDLPYFPITPTFPWLGPLGLLPLPSKWYIEFGEPIEASGDASNAADPAVIAETADQVHDAIALALQRLLGQRRSVWR